ncbi:hypothetical protein JHK87_031479 [Glycine soja]|nr:hypothetical protein JHK87_031479 [Glycine soja]
MKVSQDDSLIHNVMHAGITKADTLVLSYATAQLIKSTPREFGLEMTHLHIISLSSCSKFSSCSSFPVSFTLFSIHLVNRLLFLRLLFFYSWAQHSIHDKVFPSKGRNVIDTMAFFGFMIFIFLTGVSNNHF